MTDRGRDDTQVALDKFGDGGPDRPAGEARAVAGNGGQGADVVDLEDRRYPDADGHVEFAVTQVDYTVRGRGDDEYPVLHVFGRTAERDLEHVEVHEFRPYFYAPTDSLDAPPEQEYDRLTDSEETDENGDPYESIRGERLTKIFGQTPRDVGNLRDEFDHFEADILFPNRLLIDKDITSGVRVPERRTDDGVIRIPHDELETVELQVEPRVCTFDIEVDDRRGFPEDGEEPIVCLTSHDSYRDEYVAWLYNAPDGDVPPPEAVADHDLLDAGATVEIRAFESEEAMLEAFVGYLGETDADIMTGWNFADFDAPYLVARLDELGLDSDRLSRVDEVWAGGWGGPDIKGRVVFDLLYAYKRTQFTELESYRLDAVAETELGVGKERYAGDIGDLWEDDPERLLEYNLRDVELCVELDRKQNIIPFWEEVASFVGCKLEDATTPGDAVDMYVLHKVHGDFVLPSKGKHEGEDYEGGAVFDPITGVREMVSVLDLKCFSGDTEILTPNGSKDVRELEVGDPIYTLDPETFECEVEPVAETHEYDNSFGELHHLRGTTHDFKVTENHRFLASRKRGWDDLTPEDFEFVEYRDLTDTERFAFPDHEPMPGRTPESFGLVDEVDGGNAEVIEEHADRTFLKYERQHRETPTAFDMEDWLAFLGWYVTEGSVDSARGRVTLHQSDETGRERICTLLDRMGLNYSADVRGVNLSNQYLADWLRENCGKGFRDKRLPDWVFELDGDLLTVLLETLIRGDGSRTESGLGQFWTKSDDLKDAIADIAVRCGHKPTVTKQSDGTWYVSVGKQGSFKKASNATVEAHDGKVYCVTAEDNHVVLAGRNGHFQWIGQSLYPMAMTTINASPETKVGEDYDGETYRAPNGMAFRKEPDGIIREMVDELLEEREQKKGLRDEHDPNTDEYDRFDRQQQAVKVIMNCFTPDTEVLTPDGVRRITDLDVGDDVYSLDPETTEMEVKPVVETHAYPDYRGELVDIETSKIDFRVTPNHRMLVRKNDKNGITEDEWGFVEAGDLYDYCHYEMPHDWSFDHGDGIDEVDLVDYVDGEYEVWVRPSVRGRTFTADLGWQPPLVYKDDLGVEGYVFTPEQFDRHREYIEEACERSYIHREAGRKWIPRTYDGDDFLDLLAWYVTEGDVYTSEAKQYGEKLRGPSTTIKIAQELVADGGDDHARIGALLGDALQSLCGAGSHDKRIPEFVFDLGERQKRRFLETLVAGDGDRKRNSWRYSTASEQLRDDVLRLCAHLGITASYSYDSGCWRIYVTEDATNSFRMSRSGGRSEAEDGVYCVTVEDNNTLLAGRNGKFQNISNSLYGVLGWDRFRLYDREMGAAVTATGREVIKFTETAANELDKEVVYGDSITGDRPVVVRDPDGIVRVLPIAELFERAEVLSGSEVPVETNGGVVGSENVGKERAVLRDWEALSLSPDGDPEWQPIEQVIRHATDKGVVKLQHKFGESVTTRDHSYVIEDDDGFVEAAPRNVNEPLRVPGLPEVEPVDVIDIYEVLDGYEREYEDGRGTGGTTVKTKRVHANEEHVWFGHEHYDEFDSTVKVQRYVERGTDEFDALLRLLAAYVSEGSATTTEQLRDDYHCLFANATASIIDSDAREERTVEYSTDEEDTETTYDDRTRKLQMMNELSAVFFREFAGQTSRGKRLPGFVFNLPRDEQDLFLDVLVEGDGSREFPRYSEAYAERNFDFETASRELAAGLSMLLVQRGKKHSLKYRDSKDSYTVRTCDYYRSGRSPVLTNVDHEGYVYDLSVAKNENFVDGVGGIVLHNTDSVMLELGGDISKEEAIERSFQLEEYINGRYDEFAREELDAEFHRFEIEFEKLYRRFFQAGKKKRYAGHAVWREGKDVDDIDITGFEYKRSDIAPITKEVQLKVLRMIVEGDQADDVKAYVKDIVESFQQSEVSIEKIGVPGGIGQSLDEYDNASAHVRGARYANVLFESNFGRGSKPKHVYLERVLPKYFDRIENRRPEITENPAYREFKRNPDVICFEYVDELPDEFIVDYDEMLEKTIEGPISRIIEALGISWEELVEGEQQTGLGQYM